MTRDIPHTYTAREAAERLGIGLTSLYAAVQRGELPSIRVGRRVLVPRRSLDVLLGATDAGNREGGSS
jgi:excisionase family DNA binding protein